MRGPRRASHPGFRFAPSGLLASGVDRQGRTRQSVEGGAECVEDRTAGLCRRLSGFSQAKRCGAQEGKNMMSKLGKRLIASAKEARAIARGEADPATYRVHVPPRVDVAAIRKRAGLSQNAFAAKFGIAPATLR